MAANINEPKRGYMRSVVDGLLGMNTNRFFSGGALPTASRPESFVSFRTPAFFSRCSSLRIFPNALSSKIKPNNQNMKPMLPTVHLHLSNK